MSAGGGEPTRIQLRPGALWHAGLVAARRSDRLHQAERGPLPHRRDAHRRVREERLLTASFLDEGPTWAPNGRVIMFTRETAGRGRGNRRCSRSTSPGATCGRCRPKVRPLIRPGRRFCHRVHSQSPTRAAKLIHAEIEPITRMENPDDTSQQGNPDGRWPLALPPAPTPTGSARVALAGRGGAAASTCAKVSASERPALPRPIFSRPSVTGCCSRWTSAR